MIMTYKYALRPTKTQEQKLLDWLEHLCELHNSARLNRIRAYQKEGVSVSYYEQQKLLTQARVKYDEYRCVPQDFQNHALRRVHKAFANFFRRVRNGEKAKGFPRYRKRVRSLTWSLRKNKKGVRETPIVETDLRHNRLKVPKLGEVKIRMHRPLLGDPKEVSIVKKASGWYAHIACDIGDTQKVEPTNAIAVDMGTIDYPTTFL